VLPASVFPHPPGVGDMYRVASRREHRPRSEPVSDQPAASYDQDMEFDPIDWNAALTTFGLLFLAEMGDKTQLATITMVARTEAPWAVFLGASLALVSVTLLGVLAGSLLSRWIPPVVLHRAAAVGFIAIGALMLLQGEKG